MRVEELKNMLERAVKAQKDAFEEMLQSNSEEVMKKYENCVKVVADLEAQVEKAESNGKVPAPKATDLTESQKFVKKFIEAVSTSGNFSGGMPKAMASEVIKKLQQIGGLQSKCRSITTSSDIAITVEGGLPTVAYVAEGGAVGVSDPSSTPVVIAAYKLGTIVKINRELVGDVTFDVIAWVEDVIARAIAAKLEEEILFGAGPTSQNIEGITTKSGIKSKTCASTTAPTWAEVKACLSALGAYKKGATIVVSQEIADVIDDFKDGSGNYLFPQNEELQRIKGHEVVISEAMPTAGAGKVLMVAGNFNYYEIGYRENVYMNVLNELYAGNDQVGVQCLTRLDGRVLQAEAFSVLVAHA